MKGTSMKTASAICATVLLGALQPLCSQPSGKSDKRASQAKISRADAEKIALSKEPGTIKDGELENENGKVIYSFDIQTSSGVHEVNINARTGEVIEDSVETAADESKERSKETPK